mgnify:CR=1 FL=1
MLFLLLLLLLLCRHTICPVLFIAQHTYLLSFPEN